MNWRNVIAVAKKDWIEVRQNQAAWVPMLVVPLVFVVFLPLVVILAPRFAVFTSSFVADPDLSTFLERMPSGLNQYLVGLDIRQKMLVAFMGMYFAPMFLIMPLMFASIIAAESFAGERERKTLEALLYTPASDAELFAGKVLAAALPALLVTWGSFLLFAIVVNTAGYGTMGRIWFPLPTGWPLIFWITPALTALGIAATVLISARTRTFMGAYQLSGSLVVLVLALMVGQLTGLVYLTIPVEMLTGVLIWLVAIALMAIGIRLFNRKNLLVNG